MLKNFVKCAMAGAVLLNTSAFAAPSVIDTATFNGHTYKLLSADTWTASEAFAVSDLAAHLVTVNDAAENAFLINRFGSSVSLWLGLHRVAPHDPAFMWADGTAVAYTNWAGGEPNDCGGCVNDLLNGEQYAHTYTNGTWNDLNNTDGYSGPKYGVVELPVPEPQAWLMVLAGLGVVGVGAARKKG